MLVIGLLVSLVAFGQKNDSPEVLLGAGLHQEEVEANCKEAIKIYEKVTKQKNAPRNVMARAQLHIGICREKLALRETRAAYQQVLDNYADQRDIAAQATGLLTALEAKSTTLPEAFLGVWNGIVDEPVASPSRYRTSVKLFGGSLGTVVGTFAYSDPLDCGGEWTLRSISSDSIELVEKLRPGRNQGCADGGLITLKLASNAALEYRWHHERFRNVATATLSKSGPQE
jgi:hypothetical protein